MGHKTSITKRRTARMQVLIRQKDVECAPNRRSALRVARTLTSIRFDLPEIGGRRVLCVREGASAEGRPLAAALKLGFQLPRMNG